MQEVTTMRLLSVPSLLIREIWIVIKETVHSWLEDKGSRMAAALAFYTTFSLAPALLIGLAVAQAFVGTSTAQSELALKLGELIGPANADYVFKVLESSWGNIVGRHQPIIGVGAALFAATVVFAELQGALNSIWNVRSEGRSGLLRVVRTRAVSFIVIVGIGVLLLVSVAASAAFAAINAFFADSLPVPPHVTHALNLVISFAMIPLLLAFVYKLLPDERIAWSDVWVGAVVTSLLFLVGKWIIGIYLSVSTLQSVYGAAGSFVIVLVWVYYSAQVFFFGAELTKVYTRRYGSQAPSRESAVDRSSS